MSEENKEIVDEVTPTADEVVDEEVKEETPAEAEEETPKEETPEEEATEETPEEETPEEEPNLEYNEYDDPALRQVVNLLKDAKVPVEVTNEIFGEAVETGDISKVDVAALKEKVGETQAETIMVMANAYLSTTYAGFQETRKAAFELTEGEGNYDGMVAWAAEKSKNDPAFAKDMQEYRQLVDTGSAKAMKAAISDLFSLYKADPNTTIEANLQVGDKRSDKSGIKPLSRLEHGRLVQEAIDKGTYDKEKAKLWAMRQEGIKQNIN